MTRLLRLPHEVRPEHVVPENHVPDEHDEDEPTVKEVSLLSGERVSDLELFAAIALIALIALVFWGGLLRPFSRG